MKRILLMFLCFLLGVVAAYFCSGCLTVNKFYPDRPNYIYKVPDYTIEGELVQ